MKKIKTVIFVLASFMLLSISPNMLKAEESISPKHAADKVERTNTLPLRLDEMNEKHESKLTSSERKEIRKEKREMRKSGSGDGVYLSVGAIIIIVLLLIILL